MSTLLQNKVAIVTGASRGIGRATAEALAAAGASVVLAARTGSEIQAVAEKIKASGGEALAIPTDVTSQSAIDQLVMLTLRAFRHIDILVNNAGLLTPIGRTWEVDPAQWQRLMSINVNGPFLCTRAVLPQMLDRGEGCIINVTSGAANSNVAGWSAYCASKAALDRFTGVLAAEVSDTDITVCGVNPGPTDTDMQTQIRNVGSRRSDLPVINRLRQLHDDGELYSPQDVARLIVWMAANPLESGTIVNFADEDIQAQMKQDLA